LGGRIRPAGKGKTREDINKGGRGNRQLPVKKRKESLLGEKKRGYKEKKKAMDAIKWYNQANGGKREGKNYPLGGIGSKN